MWRSSQPHCAAPPKAEIRTTGLRVLTERDVPALAALFPRAYPHYRWPSQSACAAYIGEMLFDNPWRDPELPSWVVEKAGRIVGVYGVMPRPMRLRGQPIRVAVTCLFMVDPQHADGLTALQLAKACLSGPQDLTLADGAHDLSRRLWIGLGGTVPLLYSLHWTRPLRPARYMLSLLQGRLAFSVAARPFAALVDALATRLPQNGFYREEGDLTEQPLDAAAMLGHLPEAFDGNALQPAYDARALAWLLEQAARKRCFGTLRARAVLDGGRQVIGWYLYYVRPGEVAQLLQLAARHGAFDGVLERLLADAWRQGATALRGRLDPRYAQELSRRHCWFRREESWTLVHSRHAEIMAAIHEGAAFLSRLEGEWWLRWTDGACAN